MLIELGLIPGFVTADEITRITLVGLGCGFCGGAMSVVLEEGLKSKHQNLDAISLVKKFLFAGSAQAIILGIAAFTMAAWNLEQTELELDRFSIAMGVCFALTPLVNKLIWRRSP